MIERVRDGVDNEDGDEDGDKPPRKRPADPGAEDKRLLCLEAEFMRPITAMRREGNTLSAVLRSAWDGDTLEVMTRGKNKVRASEAHVSAIAHITPEELAEVLGRGVEVANGFANRFLFGLVRSTRSLPHGGDPAVLDPFVMPFADALAKAKGRGQLRRSAEADRLWEEVYGGLKRSKPGAYGKAVERARPQSMRLALVYALIDGSDTIHAEHLRAALAVWGYCDASARMIFGGGSGGNNTPTPPPLETALLDAILAQPGISRRGLHQATGGKVKADAMDRALAYLEKQRLAHPRQIGTAERPAECWFPGECERTNEVDDPDEDVGGDEGSRTNEQSLPPIVGEDSSFARSDAVAGGSIGMAGESPSPADESIARMEDEFLEGLDRS